MPCSAKMDAREKDSGKWSDLWCLLLTSSGWWRLISSVFLTRTSYCKTTYANGYYGAWPGCLARVESFSQCGSPNITSHVVGGIKLGLSETSGSLLGTDSPWSRWCNKLYSTVLRVLWGVFCDSGFHNNIIKLGSQIIDFYVCREHALGIINLQSTLGRIWVSYHYCFIDWGYVLWSSKPAFLSHHWLRWLSHLFSTYSSLEGNGNPLQCSCLENPRDGSLVGCHLWGRTESDTTEVT